MAMESSFKNMVLVLTIVCLVCSTILGFVYKATAEPIRLAEIAKTNTSIGEVVPAFDNTPSEEDTVINVGGKPYTVFIAKKGGEPVGYAVKSYSTGFGGVITLMVGITPDRVVYNTSVVSMSETPGLGAKIVPYGKFNAQFKDWNPTEKTLKVKKDGGDVDAITAATITSRAFTAAVQTALDVFDQLCPKTNTEGNEPVQQ
jgi:electron transport complex protein RnfG